MQLLSLYTLWKNGDITEDEVAASLNITTRVWRIRCGKQGHKLPMVLDVLDKIAADSITRDEAAQALQVSVRGLNLLMKSWGVARPIRPGVVQRAAAKVKWEVRKKYAIDYIGADEDLDNLAERAGIGPRQLRRWVSDLLKKHYDMAFKDLKQIPLVRRRQLAKDIEESEGLELAKQQMMKAVLVGQKTAAEEAFDRLAAKRAKKLNVRRR